MLSDEKVKCQRIGCLVKYIVCKGVKAERGAFTSFTTLKNAKKMVKTEYKILLKKIKALKMTCRVQLLDLTEYFCVFFHSQIHGVAI